jgi:hypothetical protein
MSYCEVLLRIAFLVGLGELSNAGLLPDRHWRGPVFGYCDTKYLYASDDRAISRSASKIFRQPLVISQDEERKRTETFSVGFPIDIEAKRLYRWRITENAFFGSSAGIGANDCIATRIPLTDLDLFDDSDPIPYDKRRDQRAKRYPFDRDLVLIHGWGLDPLYRLYEKARDTRPHQFTEVIDLDGSVRYDLVKEPKFPNIFVDELPVGTDKIKLFVLENRRIEVWEGSYVYEKPRPDDPEHVPVWTAAWCKKPVEVIPSAFNSSFQVMSRGNDYYFITDFGSIYFSPKPAKGEREMYPVWTKERDPDRNPITHVITDVTTARSFAFDMAERVGFFEIAPIPDFEPERPEIVHTSKSQYPLKQVRDCVNTLIKYRKIKPPAEETPKEKK